MMVKGSSQGASKQGMFFNLTLSPSVFGRLYMGVVFRINPSTPNLAHRGTQSVGEAQILVEIW
jgi:hypothetical protein